MRAPLHDRLRTVRGKLAALAALLVAVVLTTSAVGLIIAQERVLLHGIDEALRQRADNIAGTIAGGQFGSRLPAEGDPEDSFLQVLGPTGRVIAASPNAAGLAAVVPPRPEDSPERLTTDRGIALSSGDFRVLARRVGSGPDARTLVVSKNLDDVNESVRILESSLAISIPLVTLVLGWLVWWLTGRALRPVESIRAEVADIQGTELHRRVPTPPTYDEISRLATTMNAMLDRVEQATEGQRRFVADASHELRGPLTRMRSSLEVVIRHPGTTEPGEVYRSLLDDAVDLQQLVDDMLFLARADAGALPVAGDPVDLDDLVLEEARRLREETSVQVDTSGVSGARTAGDQRQLARVVRNLAGNAARHACSEVRFELRENGARCVLVVADDGPGVPREHRDTVFQRFTRRDDARSPDAGGVGLGLAIVADIVTRHAGEVTIEDGPSDGRGARFVVRLPRAD